MSLDEQVVAHVATGDERAAATIVIREMGPSAFGYLRAVLRDEDDAAEAFSIFAESIWAAVAGFRRGASLRSWTLAVAWNAARRLRAEAWRRRRQPIATSEAAALARDVAASSAVHRERRAGELDSLRRALDPDEQHLLILRLDQRLSWTEIASVLSGGGEQVSAASLRKRFERIKERMARLARERGLVEEDAARRR